jgi:hypothetical protein
MNSQLHAPAALPWGKALSIHLVRGWVGTKAGLEAVDKSKIFPCQEWKPSPPIRIPSLYRQTDRHGEANKIVLQLSQKVADIIEAEQYCPTQVL